MLLANSTAMSSDMVRVGMIADPQYADKQTGLLFPSRHYRASLSKLSESIAGLSRRPSASPSSGFLFFSPLSLFATLLFCVFLFVSKFPSRH
jgi:hypothetical protein